MCKLANNDVQEGIQCTQSYIIRDENKKSLMQGQMAGYIKIWLVIYTVG